MNLSVYPGVVPNMRTAVVRVEIDPEGTLSEEQYVDGVESLRRRGFEVVVTPVEHLPARGREIELIVAGEDPDRLRTRCTAECAEIFGTPARPGVVTYISRGTDEDALGVMRGFGLTGGEVRRTVEENGEVVTVTVTRDDLTRVPESRLHTALEAALNCEVRIVTRRE